MEKSEIISNKNKYKLWDDFNSKGYFNNVMNDEFESIQQIFEKSINEINKRYQSQKFETIEKANDEIETIFKKSMLIFNEQRKANKIENHRMNNLTKLMKNKENEMNEILNPVKPKEIDFQNENNDEPFRENVEEMINKTLEERQKELSAIIESIPKPDNLKNEIIDNNDFSIPPINHENKEQILINENFSNDNNKELQKEILKSQIKIIELLESVKIQNETIINTINKNSDNNEVLTILYDIQNNIKSNKKKKKEIKDKI